VTSHKSGPKFTTYHGNLYFEDVDVELDCSTDTSGGMRILRFNASEDPNYVKKQLVSIDRNTTFTMLDANYGEGMVALFTPYFRLVAAKHIMNKDQYEAKFGGMDDELAPELIIDGRCTMTFTAAEASIVKPYHAGDFEDLISYPNFVDTNGSDIKPSKVTVNENAYLNIKNGIGMYSGSQVHITLNGGTIIAGTGLVLRGGSLTIPSNSNVTVIGTGNFVRYIPYHSLVQRLDPGKTEPTSGSDHCLFLNLGHAIVLECNGTNYGGKAVEADIQGGNLVSYNNTPIGSYGLGVTSTPSPYSGVNALMSYNGTSMRLYFYQRLTKFIQNCEMNRPPAGIAHDYPSGHYPDYDLVASTSKTSTKCTIYKELAYA